MRVGGIVVARQRPGTAKGVVFLLLEDETGTVNVIVPPKVYARDRLTVRTEPLVVVEGVLERFASAGGAINLLVRRIAPLDAPDLLSRRRTPRSRTSRCSTRASSRGSRSSSRAWPWRRPAARRPPTCARAGRRRRPPPRPSRRARAPRPSGRAASGPPRAARRPARRPRPRPVEPLRRSAPPGTPGPPAHDPAEPDEPLPASGTGAEDFRAVAPPIMSFAQGRRR